MSYTSYNEDRFFTDKVHKLAEEKIYPLLNINLTKTDNEELKEVNDNKRAIDYQGTIRGKTVKIQERFRRYTNNSFTLRYLREHSEFEVERFSEFFKLKQELNFHNDDLFYMVYGVPNYNFTDFICVAVIDLKAFYKRIKNKQVIVDMNQKFDSKIENNILVGAIFQNRDDSSCMSFFNFDQIDKLFPEIIIYQEGFNIESKNTFKFITEKQNNYIRSLARNKNNIKPRMTELLTSEEASLIIDACLNVTIKDIAAYLYDLVYKGSLRFNPLVNKDNPENNPLCPVCKIPMTFKKGKYGYFYGCPNFPTCNKNFPIK